MVLAARMLLLLSVIGGFVLAYHAVRNPDILKLAICGVYDFGVILPLAYPYLRVSHDEGTEG